MNVPIEQAFTPAREIDDPERFAGRAIILKDLAGALGIEGGHIVIFGNRGVGKSSVGRQLEALSRADPRIIAKMPDVSKFDFLTVYFQCEDSVLDVDTLLTRLLTEDDALAPWIPFRITTRQQSVEGGGKVSIKVLELSGKAGGNTVEKRDEVEADIISTFKNAIKAIGDAGVAKDGVLLIVDEFDRIKDRSGFAALLKTLGNQHKVKFALIGVAKDVIELIEEHASITRQLTGGVTHIPPMPDNEMAEIISRGEAKLGGAYKFSEGARKLIVGLAKGHPYLVHVLGRHSLIVARLRDTKDVLEEDVRTALTEVAEKQSAPMLENLYKKAVGHSYMREFILKNFAMAESEEVRTTDIYPRLAAELGTEGPVISVYVGQLASEKYGNVLEKVRERYYKLPDSLFKAYACARPYLLRPGQAETDSE